MALTPEEQALFDTIPTDDVAPQPAQSEADELPPLEEPDADEVRAQLEAAQKAQAAKKAHRMPVHDVPADVPPPEPEAKAEQGPPPCKCGATITPENGSKLRDGSWKHIGCPADKPAAPPPPPKAPRAKKASEAPPPPPKAPELADAGKAATTPPPAPAAFAGERQSDRDATAALDAIQQAKPPAVTAPVQVPEHQFDKAAEAFGEVAVMSVFGEARQFSAMADVEQVKAREQAKRHALASVFDSIAALLRAA